MQHFLFFDPFKKGHRRSYVEAFLNALRRRQDVAITFAVHEEIAAAVQAEQAEEVPENAMFQPVSADIASSVATNNKDLYGAFHLVRMAEHLAKTCGCHGIYYMNMDTVQLGIYLRQHWLTQLLLGTEPRQSGLLFFPTLHYPAMFGDRLPFKERFFNIIKNHILSRLIANPRFQSVLAFDGHAVQFLDPEKRKLVEIPDFAPVPEKGVSPKWLPNAWNERRNRLLFFGVINRYKGVLEFLDALMHLSSGQAEQTSVVIAGRVEATLRDALSDRLARLRERRPELAVHLRDEYVPDVQLWWLACSCTFVVIPYLRHEGSSGVMCWAAQAGKPTITQDFGFIGYETRRLGLGITLDPTDVGAFVGALTRALGEQRDPAISEKGIAKFAEATTEVNFTEATLDALIKRMEADD